MSAENPQLLLAPCIKVVNWANQPNIVVDESQIQDEAKRNAFKDIVGDVLGHFTVRTRGIVCDRFGLLDGQPQTIEDIAARLTHIHNPSIIGVTNHAVEQALYKVSNALRHEERFNGYLTHTDPNMKRFIESIRARNSSVQAI